MKIASLIFLAASLAALPALSQERVWRCGNEYTNNATVAQQKGCKVLEGGNVTVVQGTKPSGGGSASSGSAPAATRAPAGSPRVEGVDQRARDGEARSVLEAELKKAEARQAELQKEYNNGEPERRGEERNAQKYLDRVAEMKAAITRKEADLAAIKRELAKLPPT
jgi:chromosome segregation ATPase